MKNNEAAADGETFKFDTGRLTKASTSDYPDYIVFKRWRREPTNSLRVIAVRADQVVGG